LLFFDLLTVFDLFKQYDKRRTLRGTGVAVGFLGINGRLRVSKKNQ